MNPQRSILPWAATAVVWAAVAGGAAAQPDTFRPFRFVPLRSVLTQLGDPASLDLSVHGTFIWATTNPDTDGLLRARFEAVEAIGAHPLIDIIVDVNEVLALDRLVGEQLPVAGPFDLFAFTGKTAEGSEVNLTARLFGPWLSLEGTAIPLPDADLPAYEIRAWAHDRPFADFNDDAMVSAADLAILTEHFGEGPFLGDATRLGDATGDGSIDGADFLAWQQAVGENWLPEEPQIGGGAVGMPEPSGAVLALLACAVLMTRWRAP